MKLVKTEIYEISNTNESISSITLRLAEAKGHDEMVKKAITHPLSDRMSAYWYGEKGGGPFTKDYT
jgi:hypothetical protein